MVFCTELWEPDLERNWSIYLAENQMDQTILIQPCLPTSPI